MAKSETVSPLNPIDVLADSFPNVVIEQQREMKMKPLVEGQEPENLPIVYIAHLGIPGKGVISAGGVTVSEALTELKKLQEKTEQDSIVV